MKTINVSGEIGYDVWPDQIRRALEEANGEDINLIVSSPGGYVSDGLEIYNLIKNYEGHVTATLSGFAMSMASYIPLAADKVVAEDNAVYMIHNVKGGVWGDHNDILKYGQMCRGLSSLIGKVYVNASGKDVDEIAGLMDAETYFFGKEIVDAGFADEVVDAGSDSEESDPETATASARLAFQSINEKMSNNSERLKEDLRKASALASLQTTIGRTVGQSDKEEKKMNLTQLKEKHPDLVKAIADEATAGHAEALTAAREEGAKAERERIKAVHGQSFPGFEKIVADAMFDGKSNAGDVAMEINAANLKAQKEAGKDLSNDAPNAVEEPLNNGEPSGDNGPMTEEKLKAKWDKDKKVRDEFMDDFELFKAYAMEDKNVKVKKLTGLKK